MLFGRTQYNTIYWDNVEQMTTIKNPGKMTRAILHSDLNAVYASVELMLDPSLRGKAVAVCGNTEERHGIVLAKSELAKKAGIKTSMVNWEARKLCPKLIMVPPQYEQLAYLLPSKLPKASASMIWNAQKIRSFATSFASRRSIAHSSSVRTSL